MEARNLNEEKYPIHKSSLQFLQKTVTEPLELALKLDLLMNAIYEKDENFAKEIIFSPGDISYLNFQFDDKAVYNSKNEMKITKNYNSAYYPPELPCTPLTLAVYLGLTNIVEWLLKHGADVNLPGPPKLDAQTGYRYTPLEYAVHHQKTYAIKNKIVIEEYKEIVDLLKNYDAIIDPEIEKLDTGGLMSNQPKVTHFFYLKKTVEEKTSNQLPLTNKN